MVPRFLVRTHYQVDEPAYLRIIIQCCTSAARSEYPEQVATRLAEQAKRQQISLNQAAARYAIDLARAAHLLNDNMVWTDLAQLLNCLLAGEQEKFRASLTLPEKLFFFRVFFVSDGAAILHVAQEITRSGEILEKNKTWAQFANEMSVSIYSKYLDLIGDTESRIRVRQAMEKRYTNPYKGKSGPHQSYIHLHALYRMGLLDKRQGNSRQYCILPLAEREKQPLEILLQHVPDLRSLERTIQNQEWLEIAAHVFADQLPNTSENANEISPETFLHEFWPAYEQVIGTGVPFCPISVLIEWSQISRLSSGRPFVSFQTAMYLIEALRSRYPREVRFHVDRTGNPAYLKIDKNLAT